MNDKPIARAVSAIERLAISAPLGRVTDLGGGTIGIGGLQNRARLGDRVEISGPAGPVVAEVLHLGPDIRVLPETATDGLAIGAPARMLQEPHFAPHEGWLGRVIDPDGKPLDGRPLLMGRTPRAIKASPPQPQDRRALGARMTTGLAVFDTFLPLVAGQRIGLFAGSGVGKSTLLGEFARGIDADVVVISLVGERGRELREFVEEVLGSSGLARSVVVAATSDRAPQTRRRCAWSAMAVAEHFRDAGQNVLLLMDSVTRFAEAHRELAIAGGEPANLRGFPPSTGPAIAALCERAGPGPEGGGDITAVFTVLVAGSDMEEPVADMLRGVLDGHTVLDREIAERGRFPAVNLLRSVSRALPQAATEGENVLLTEARRLVGVYDRAEMMIQAGLYAQGSDPEIDRAIALHPAIERFMSLREPKGVSASFAALRTLLHT